MFWRRRLPHWVPEDSIVFVTWRLAGTLPRPAPELLTSDPDPGRIFLLPQAIAGRNDLYAGSTAGSPRFGTTLVDRSANSGRICGSAAPWKRCSMARGLGMNTI